MGLGMSSKSRLMNDLLCCAFPLYSLGMTRDFEFSLIFLGNNQGGMLRRRKRENSRESGDFADENISIWTKLSVFAKIFSFSREISHFLCRNTPPRSEIWYIKFGSHFFTIRCSGFGAWTRKTQITFLNRSIWF